MWLLSLSLRWLIVNTSKDVLLDSVDDILCEVALFKTNYTKVQNRLIWTPSNKYAENNRFFTAASIRSI
jgi:hypothetical protein